MKKILLIIILLAIAGAFLYAKWNNLRKPILIGEKLPFKIEKGMNAEMIVEKLNENELIEDDLALLYYLKITDKGNDFIAGTYWLRPEYNSFDLIEVFGRKGERVGKVTIIEGWDQMQIAAKLAEQDIVSGLEFVNELENNDWQNQNKWNFWQGKPENSDLEGYLYPDTYFFDPSNSPKQIIGKMLDNFDKKLTEDLRNEIKKQGKTVYEVLTLASIVEREMFGYEDRRMVADIFLKRLDEGIPLQSDATINYITQKGTTRPSYADLEIQHPYNTYENKGLPPGPICNPSIEAIKAVIFPKENEYYYFLNTEDGEIMYSQTFEEHVRKKQKYLN